MLNKRTIFLTTGKNNSFYLFVEIVVGFVLLGDSKLNRDKIENKHEHYKKEHNL